MDDIPQLECGGDGVAVLLDGLTLDGLTGDHGARVKASLQTVKPGQRRRAAAVVNTSVSP